jgi:hypothetical protein
MYCWFWIVLTVLAMSCGGPKDDSTGGETDADTDSDSDTDTDTDTDTDAQCVALTEGHWDLGGGAFGMAMDADVAMDVKGCTFAFTNWNMAMSVPDGGTIDGSDVALQGSGYWGTCTGTVKSPTQAAGTCSDDGANWFMELIP